MSKTVLKVENLNMHYETIAGNVSAVRDVSFELKQGESFEYTSFCPLPTEFGVMHGHFEMIYENGKKINAKIAPFRLTIPFSIN